jgi:hypothetical protein
VEVESLGDIRIQIMVVGDSFFVFKEVYVFNMELNQLWSVIGKFTW